MAQTQVVIRPSSAFRIGLAELWRYRDLLLSLVEREIKVRYKQTLIGVAWAVVQPLFMVLVFTLFFGRLAKMPSGDLPYPVFVLSGMILWHYFAASLIGAANSLVEYKPLLSKVYFPRLVLPIAAVLVGSVDFGISLILLIAFASVYGVKLQLTFLFAPVFFVMTAFTALSVGLWLSSLNAMYRDVRYALPFLVQLWMFISPVVYPSSLLPESWQWIYALNPMVGLIEGFRWCVMGQGQVPILLWVSMSVVVLILVGGIVFFRQTERTLSDWI
ncbi:MAG: ABC transporter permease [Bacteroidia bacterium]|nr:ABC transporter permease [Bacteroidia bacterium]